MGGASGAILTGVFATAAAGGASGLVDGNPGQVVTQAIAIIAVAGYTGVMTFILLKVIGAVTPLRPSEGEEAVGMDILSHGEEAYASADGSILILDDEVSEGGVA